MSGLGGGRATVSGGAGVSASENGTGSRGAKARAGLLGFKAATKNAIKTKGSRRAAGDGADRKTAKAISARANSARKIFRGRNSGIAFLGETKVI